MLYRFLNLQLKYLTEVCHYHVRFRWCRRDEKSGKLSWSNLLFHAISMLLSRGTFLGILHMSTGCRNGLFYGMYASQCAQLTYSELIFPCAFQPRTLFLPFSSWYFLQMLAIRSFCYIENAVMTSQQSRTVECMHDWDLWHFTAGNQYGEACHLIYYIRTKCTF